MGPMDRTHWRMLSGVDQDLEWPDGHKATMRVQLVTDVPLAPSGRPYAATCGMVREIRTATLLVLDDLAATVARSCACDACQAARS